MINNFLSSEEHEPTSITGEVDFLEAGVSFFQRQCLRRGNTGLSAVSYRQRGSGAGPANRRRPPESLVGGAPFDQLWLWKCYNYTSDGSDPFFIANFVVGPVFDYF
ncbi:hypothetical protein NQ315_012217 [Exocentrus adspersus]|uniref:Uncharacterized protein n=1 Tax=Exocentrus adspersus TaxID=1586481 RepID=A0AAV8VYW3_9CUCU|nr:hypothetical protein NQ315_012217 [Exocentrus adspersus]